MEGRLSVTMAMWGLAQWSVDKTRQREVDREIVRGRYKQKADARRQVRRKTARDTHNGIKRERKRQHKVTCQEQSASLTTT